MNLSSLGNDLPKRATLVVVALALVASVVTGREKPSSFPEPVTRIETRVEVEADIDLSRLERPAAAVPRHDPFARRSFTPPARQAPQAASAEPPRPAAPALPFRYLGRLTQHGKTEVFVMRGEDIISIAPGQKIDAEYRVEGITESAISMTYLPLKTRQALELPQ